MNRRRQYNFVIYLLGFICIFSTHWFNEFYLQYIDIFFISLIAKIIALHLFWDFYFNNLARYSISITEELILTLSAEIINKKISTLFSKSFKVAIKTFFYVFIILFCFVIFINLDTSFFTSKNEDIYNKLFFCYVVLGVFAFYLYKVDKYNLMTNTRVFYENINLLESVIHLYYFKLILKDEDWYLGYEALLIDLCKEHKTLYERLIGKPIPKD